MKRLLAVAALFAVAAGVALAPPAKADSFSFGYSTGGWHSRPWYGPGPYHRGPPPRYYGSSYSYYGRPYWGPPAYAPRVVVVQPPPVAYYSAPPPVMYAPSPYGQLSAVPASPVYQTANGQYCREYQAGVTVNGQMQPSYGTACLMPDGAWRVVN